MRGKLRYRSLRISIQRENRLNSSVYWIHRPEHTDMFSQGYIGVSNNTKLRWREHETRTGNLHLQRAIAKYSWDNLVKEVIVIADELYCLAVEFKLRSADKIGWNIVAGGGMPPHINVWNKGRKIPPEELAIMKSKGFGFEKGCKTWNAGLKYTEEMIANIYDIGSHTRGKPAYNRGKPILPHVLEALRQANLGRTQSEESNNKRSLANKGRVFELVTCPHCKTIGGATTMGRWHFNKCTGAKLLSARTTINGKRLFLGRYATREQVAIAVKKAHLGE